MRKVRKGTGEGEGRLLSSPHYIGQTRGKSVSSRRATRGDWGRARLPLGTPHSAELHEGAQLRASGAPPAQQPLDPLGLRGGVQLVKCVPGEE